MRTAEELVQAVETLGGRLLFVPPEHVNIAPARIADEQPELIEELLRNREEVTRLLSGFDCQVRFGEPHDRLFAYLGRTVGTPSGRGGLVQVFSDRTAVVIQGRCVFCLPSEVQP